jgi:hypothetical protein
LNVFVWPKIGEGVWTAKLVCALQFSGRRSTESCSVVQW